jgi:hypothetical protein
MIFYSNADKLSGYYVQLMAFEIFRVAAAASRIISLLSAAARGCAGSFRVTGKFSLPNPMRPQLA